MSTFYNLIEMQIAVSFGIGVWILYIIQQQVESESKLKKNTKMFLLSTIMSLKLLSNKVIDVLEGTQTGSLMSD